MDTNNDTLDKMDRFIRSRFKIYLDDRMRDNQLRSMLTDLGELIDEARIPTRKHRLEKMKWGIEKFLMSEWLDKQDGNRANTENIKFHQK